MPKKAIDFSNLGGVPVQQQPARVDFSDLGGRPVQAAPGAQQDQKKEGFWSAFGSDLWNMVKAAPSMMAPIAAPVTVGEMGRYAAGNTPAAQQMIQTVTEDQARKNAGRSIGYRAVAPLGGMAGMNVAGMEQAAEKGDVAGVWGHAAAPVAVTAATMGIAKGAPKVVSAASRTSLGSKLSAPLARTMNRPRGVIPAESMTPAEIKAYAEENGIGPLTAGQITEHNLPRHIQTAGERAGIGGTEIRQNIKAARASVAQHASDLMDGLSPDTPTAADIGDAIKTGIQDALERQRQTSTQKFAAIDKQGQGVNVDFRPLKELATNLLNDSSFIRNSLKSADPKRMTAILREVSELPNSGTFSQAQALRSTLFDEASHPDVAINSQAQASIKRLTAATHEQMATAAESRPGLMSVFEEASTHWRELHDAFSNNRSPFAQSLAELDPNKVAQKFMAKGQQGGSPFNVELMDKYGIDKAPIKRAILQDIYNRDFRTYGKTLAGYSDEFLRSVFTPEELAQIYKTGAIARSVGLNVNPPNTAETLDAIGGRESAVKSTFLKSGKAWLTKNSAFNDWMTRSAAPPRGQGPPAGMLPLRLLLSGSEMANKQQ